MVCCANFEVFAFFGSKDVRAAGKQCLVTDTPETTHGSANIIGLSQLQRRFGLQLESGSFKFPSAPAVL